MTKSYLTAISRKSLPVPVRWLLKNNYVYGHVLDYGCGKCKALNDKIFSAQPFVETITSYDPVHVPYTFSRSEEYNVILCTYVLCTLKKPEEKPLLRHIQSLLSPNGGAYITVRNDTPKQGWGTSSRGTFQRKVIIPYLDELRKTAQYRIYLLTKWSILT